MPRPPIGSRLVIRRGTEFFSVTIGPLWSATDSQGRTLKLTKHERCLARCLFGLLSEPRAEPRKAKSAEPTPDLAVLCTCGHSLGSHATGEPHPCRAMGWKGAPGLGCRCPEFKANV